MALTSVGIADARVSAAINSSFHTGSAAADSCAPTKTGTVAVFIDAGHLEHAAYDLGIADLDRINWQSFLGVLANGRQLLCALYYDALPYRDLYPTEPQLRKVSRRRQFHRRLETGAGLIVRLGKVEKRIDRKSGKTHFVQKRVDMRLGIDLMGMGWNRLITHAVLVAGDSDFIPAVEAVRAEGVVVHLVHGRGAHADLIASCNSHTALAAYWVLPEQQVVAHAGRQS